MNKKIGYSPISKIMGIILYLLLCLALVSSIVGTYFCLSLDIYSSGISYQESRLFSTTSKIELDSIQRITVENGYLNTDRYDRSKTNFIFSVYEVDFDESENYLWGNSEEKYENTTSFMAKGKMYKIYYDVDTSFSVDDGYYQNYQVFSFLTNFKYIFVVVLITSFVLTIIDLVYLGNVVGYSNRSNKFELNPIDKLPLEVLLALLVAIVYGYSYLVNNLAFSVVATLIKLIIGVCLVGLCFLVIVLTICSRSKQSKWFENSVLYKLFSSINDFFANMAITYKTIIVSIVCLVAIPTVIFVVLKDDLAKKILLGYAICLVVGICYFTTKLAKIKNYTKRIVNGDYKSQINVKEFSGELRKYSNDLNSISAGMDKAVQEQLKSERLKMELVTNVSHDIKTPLTLILTYADLLKNKHTASEGKQYIESLQLAATRLKKLTDDVLEVSKASTGNVQVNLAETDVNELLLQAIGEYEDKFAQDDLQANVLICKENCLINTDGQLLWRVLDNCFSNVTKYSVKGSRVYIQSEIVDNNYQIIIKNVSASELNVDANTLMERFVRGDKSRNTDGSGLGLNISTSLIHLLKGELNILIDGDLFKVIITLPLDNKN